MLVEQKKAYREKFPDKHLLSDSISKTEEYLKEQVWISPGQRVLSIEKPGEGVMNLVRRVKLADGGSFIIKQARPWVEKLPQNDAPEHRINVEWHYYKAVAEHPVLAGMAPKILGFDEHSNILLMSDLGTHTDLSSIYGSDIEISESELKSCFEYLNILQKHPAPEGFPENREMRTLNHQHIFCLPFQPENGIDLDDIQPGLGALSQSIIKDTELKESVDRLGEKYLATGQCLLHGSFNPSSVLSTEKGLQVIDPEFAFCGPYEWDYSMFMAHLYLAKSANKTKNTALDLIQNSDEFEFFQFAGFAGVEIIRRLIGDEQLPLFLSLEEKAALLDKATEWIKFGI